MRLPLQLERPLFVLAAALGVAVAGCGGTMDPPVMMAPGMTEIAIGTGSTGYEPVADEGALQVVFGSQGGYHIVVAIQANGIWPGMRGAEHVKDNPTTTLRAFRADGTEFEIEGQFLNVFTNPYVPSGASVVLLNRFLRLRINHGQEIAGERLRITAEVVDRAGRMASAEKFVIASYP